MNVKHYLAKFWFFIGIGFVILLAFIFPGLGVIINEWHILKAGIFTAFLITGLTLETGMIANEIRNFKALSASLISCFVLFPLIAFPLAKLFWADNMDLVVGVCILAIAPVTLASGIVLSGLAGGNVALSIFICVATNLAAILTIPLSLKLLLGLGQEIQLPVLKMITTLLLMILLPMVTGQVLRSRLKDVIEAWRKGFTLFSQMIVLLIILNAVANSTERIKQAGLGIVTVLVFVVVLHTLILLLNFGISRLIRLDRASVATFTIHNSQKTLTISFIIWSGYFAHFAMAMIPVISYVLTQLIMDTAVAERFRKAKNV